ncbi:MAG: di-heme oxidoredictase family protein [Pseudomonadota bacterium]
MVNRLRDFVCGALIVFLAACSSDDNRLFSDTAVVDPTRPGGQFLTFTARPNHDAAMLRSFDPTDQRTLGKDLFYRDWSNRDRDGKTLIGPYFDEPTCSSCHIETAQRGHTLRPPVVTQPATIEGRLEFGAQISRRHAHRADPEAVVRFVDHKRTITYDDGTAVTLSWREGHITRSAGRVADVQFRIAPLLFGWGLLEATDPEYIQHFHDPKDTNKDNISGVMSTSDGKLKLLGWKNAHHSVRDQIGTALLNDMGIDNDTSCTSDCALEIEQHELDALADYVRYMGVPDRRSDYSMRGQNLFGFAGCSACHVPVILTGNAETLPFSNQLLWPYTDLMTHDMGPLLADPGDNDNAQEWRTAPLWGLGIIEANYPNRGFMHDGRARSIEESILWHGGEAEASQKYFMSLSAADRNELLTFVRSL